MSANGAMEDGDSGTDLEPEVTEDDAGGESEPAPRRAADDDTSARPSRKERRGDRLAEAKIAREQAETQAREYRERLDRQEQQIAEMRGYLAAQHQRQQQDPNASVEKRIESLEDEAHSHLERAAALTDPAAKQRELRQYHSKTREATILAYEARANPKLDERFQQMQSSMPDPQIAATYSQAVSEFPWLTTDDDAASLVNTRLGQLLKAGRPRTIATIREAATAVAKRLNLGGRQAPTAQQRQRFNGVSSGEGGAGERGSRAMPEDNKTNRALAQKSFKELEPKKAWAAWTKMVMESEDDE